jgi:hypothetical protein
MGTRHLICVFYQGRFVVAQYGQYDGYPEEQGVAILKFLRGPLNIQRLKDGLRNIRKPLKHELYRASQKRNDWNNSRTYNDFKNNPNPKWTVKLIDKFCASLSTYTGGHILEVITFATARRQIPIELELDFANDFVYCEWAYVADLDTGVLEVFKGFEGHIKKTPNHRFKDVGNDDDFVPSLLCSVEFSELQSMSEQEFLKRAGRNYW